MFGIGTFCLFLYALWKVGKKNGCDDWFQGNYKLFEDLNIFLCKIKTEKINNIKCLAVWSNIVEEIE